LQVKFEIRAGARGWRGDWGIANAWVQRVSDEVMKELERVPDWSHERLLSVAKAWHPSHALVSTLTAPRDQRGFFIERLSESPSQGSPSTYAMLEGYGGRAPLSLRLGWASGNKARDRYALLSACLTYAELSNLDAASAAKDDAGQWLAMYWIARFHGNLMRVKADTMQRRSAGHRGGVQRQREARDNARSVRDAFRRLDESDRGRRAVGLICEATGLSRPTVTVHLVALGLRPAKR